MKKHIGSLVFIFICTSIAWMILGSATSVRTHEQDSTLRNAVGQLWGTIQSQQAPNVYYTTTKQREVKTHYGSETVVEIITDTAYYDVPIDGSEIEIGIDLEHRKKGLLWYATYTVSFRGRYRVMNNSAVVQDLNFLYVFPTYEGVYDNFTITVGSDKIQDLKPVNGRIIYSSVFRPGETKEISVEYKSQGLEEWWYILGSGVSHVKNFDLVMTTDFTKINFPQNSMSPTSKEEISGGWKLTWNYENLISGIQIGMEMPEKVNPGPFVSKVTFFAPISLFLFFFLIFIITALQTIKIHPMNYFFVAAAFFSFHLLLAYLADHVDIHVALIISSAVSIFLVVSYIRLVAGGRFAFFEMGLAQFVYLVLFSYSFFLHGYTGLAITILCIVTLFIIMQLTARIDWGQQFSK
ncbi:hypothetical protein A2Y85_01140 [candidate division WOR-3 bacterium RBG_13_43_14]|uniref:Cell envelope integrity protein CreD n=1 Tax=candidate division WOR-3 bacterium RBG_13_43_14 TaxID=1802590 RepID=A0A1F4UFU6_UNCW3|nr:MAG: hypothetical protein A2Y85_01140 [candidate division WOR-3 bacterium RBG_13_43_14]